MEFTRPPSSSPPQIVHCRSPRRTGLTCPIGWRIEPAQSAERAPIAPDKAIRTAVVVDVPSIPVMVTTSTPVRSSWPLLGCNSRTPRVPLSLGTPVVIFHDKTNMLRRSVGLVATRPNNQERRNKTVPSKQFRDVPLGKSRCCSGTASCHPFRGPSAIRFSAQDGTSGSLQRRHQGGR